MPLFFSDAQTQWIYLCRTVVTWRCQGSFLQIESWSTPRVKELLQDTGNAYGQELNSILLHLNPVPKPQICSLLLVDSTSSGCKAVWPAIPQADYQNREDISLPAMHVMSCEYDAACLTLRKRSWKKLCAISEKNTKPLTYLSETTTGKDKIILGFTCLPSPCKNVKFLLMLNSAKQARCLLYHQ